MKHILLLLFICLCGCTAGEVFPPSSDCQYNVYNHNGKVLPYATIHFIAWGNWDIVDDTGNTSRSPYTSLYEWVSLINNGGTVLNRLDEYGVIGAVVDQSGLYRMHQTNSANQSSVNDSGSSDQFTAGINSMLQAHQLPFPDGSTLYVILLPQGVSSSVMTNDSFDAYHFYGSYNNTRYTFAVIKYFSDGDYENEIISHEIAETLTDPYQNAFFALNNKQEIGDLCEGDYETIDGMAVQKVWSQATCSCQ